MTAIDQTIRAAPPLRDGGRPHMGPGLRRDRGKAFATDAGRVFLDHACLALAQVEAAREPARPAARPLKPIFAVGFLSGQEVNWLAETTRVLAGDMRNIEMTVSSEHSPDLAEGLATGKLDIAFMRAEPSRPDLDYITIAHEPFVVIMPSDHEAKEVGGLRSPFATRPPLTGDEPAESDEARLVGMQIDPQRTLARLPKVAFQHEHS